MGESVDKGQFRHGLGLTWFAGGQHNFLWRIKRKLWFQNEKICCQRPMHMIGIQALVLKDNTPSWQTDGWFKGIADTNITPPVQKSTELQQGPLQVAETSMKSRQALNSISSLCSASMALRYAFFGCSTDESEVMEDMALNETFRAALVTSHLALSSSKSTGLTTCTSDLSGWGRHMVFLMGRLATSEVVEWLGDGKAIHMR